jgi:hypothetical protein
MTDKLVAAEIPAAAKRMAPEVGDRWTRLSPLRLRGEAPQGTILVLVDKDRVDAVGRWISAEDLDNPEMTARVFSKMFLDLGRRAAERMACEDGTPVRYEDNLMHCHWCGARWNLHDGGGTPE